MSESDQLINRICWEVKPKFPAQEKTFEEIQVISSEPETLDKQFCLDEFKELHNSLAYIQANQKTILEAQNHILEVLTDKPKKKLSSEETNFQKKWKVNCLILAILTILLLLASITGLVIYGIYMLVT